MSRAQESPDFNLDEDLFDFAGVMREAPPEVGEEDLDEILASFQDPRAEEELLSVPKAVGSAPAPKPTPPQRDTVPHQSVVPAPTAGTLTPAAPAPAPRAKPVVRAAATKPAPETHVERRAQAAPARFTKSVVVIAAAVTLLNSALALVVLRARSSPHDVRADGAAQTAHRSEPTRTDGHDQHDEAASTPQLPEPERVVPVHDHPALDEARRQISLGEYAAARQRVYGLLAIIDRLEDPRRGALEADCQYLIAQSLHLEALARMGGTP